MNVPGVRFRPLKALPALLNRSRATPRPCYVSKWLQSRGLQVSTAPPANAVPLRKHLKDEAKRKKADAKGLGGPRRDGAVTARLQKWELTVGIEVHAELNTACKLFSSATAASGDITAVPNSNVAAFDAALPGSQPQFQVATLLPALRAAIALGCDVQRKSGWDRKHYFHWDQPNGYQITQYYQPFAKDGTLKLTAEDGVPREDLLGAHSLSIGIKQIQMEQDTAKTSHHPPSNYHIDYNRSGHPLIEIITLPHIHSPQTAAAVVRKLQGLLKAIDACTTGMELGGLRADVNVSVRQRGTTGSLSYSGVAGLGQRTEIKNLSSFKAVEDAIVAERDRQISVLEAGGAIAGETRGWSLGSTETKRLRGKEGEVDYRYMPDADLPPLFIGNDLIDHLRSSLPELPDATMERVQREYGLTEKDARTIVALDNGERLEFMEATEELLQPRLPTNDSLELGRMAGNWVLHEIGGFLTANSLSWSDLKMYPIDLADIIAYLARGEITSRTAKQLLEYANDGSTSRGIGDLIHDLGLQRRPLSDDEYTELARTIMNENPGMVAAIKEKGQKGKIMWFVGQMMRRGEEETIEPEKAKEVVERILAD
ncbi:hypothetical protein B0A48_16956 [Cryoendolithus antarcticus]|uniref:Glutamyl-tRNA(Gln) amidotransferase subunit B, mitochondrial n=1 Tax=Cryoendolithus antarcticus TaxID=1507870 RepID=A0A1V8SCV2_9PEZI|nr:hypothetical protein B0A48_16956 [Cryoendolithus antarcticus]